MPDGRKKIEIRIEKLSDYAGGQCDTGIRALSCAFPLGSDGGRSAGNDTASGALVFGVPGGIGLCYEHSLLLSRVEAHGKGVPRIYGACDRGLFRHI